MLIHAQTKDAAAVDRSEFSFEFKFAEGASDEGVFSGHGAMFNNEDNGGDVIVKGAFKKSLAAWKAKGKLPKMLHQHGYGSSDGWLPIGVWTSMKEDEVGLDCEGRLIGLDTDRGRLLYAGMKAGALDALSIGYRPIDFAYGVKPDQPYRTLKQVDLYEVSVVLFGMNDQALINGVKAASRVKTIREFEDFLRDEGGFSHAAAKAIAAGGYKANPEPRDEDGTEALLALAECMRPSQA